MMNSILIQLQIRSVLYIQRVAELVRLVTGLRTASPVSSPALTPDVQHFDRTEDCPPSRCSGTQSCPNATSGPSSPDALYSDTSPRTEDAKEHRRE